MPFHNEILAGITLIRDAIQSENYVAGTSGWSINKDGTAEFFDALLRGSVVIRGNDDPDAGIVLDTEPNGSYIELTNNDGEKFIALCSDSGADLVFSLSGTVGTVPSAWFIENVGAKLVAGDVDTDPGMVLSLSDGYIRRQNTAGSIQNWTNLTLAAGTALDPCQYKLHPDGTVWLRGIIDHPTSPIPAGTVLFTLPAGYRPINNLYCPAVFDASGTHGRFLVRSNGNVEVYEAPNDKPSLDSIRFSVL